MDVSLFGMFVTVAIAHFLALLSPGPDFVLVVKSAIKNSGNRAVGVALFTKVAYYIDKVTGSILGLIGFTMVKSALVR